MEWSGEERRTSMDIARDELFELIEKTEDKQQKAQLLVMLKMYDAIVENTKIAKLASKDIEDQRQSFKNHVEEEVKIMSKGQGMYKASIFFMGVIQSILAAVILTFYSDWKQVRQQSTDNQMAIELVREQLKTIDGKINTHLMNKQ